MLEDLERLADLMYAKFRDNLEREKAEEEEKITARFAGSGFALPHGGLYSEIIDLHIDRIRELYKKRIEIEKMLLLDKFGYIPDAEIEGLKTRVSSIINQEMGRQRDGDYFGKKLESGMMNYIEQMRVSLLKDADRDIEIEVRYDKLRLEKEKKERFSTDYVDSLMHIFRLRDSVNLHFKNKFRFQLFRLEQEGIIPEIVKPCEIETDFVMKIALLGNLIDWMNVDGLKSMLKGETKGIKSIGLLEAFLKQEFSVFEGKIIKNLRTINELRNRKFPIHKEGEEVIDIFADLGEKYPPDNWGILWKKVLDSYVDSLKNLILLFQK